MEEEKPKEQFQKIMFCGKEYIVNLPPGLMGTPPDGWLGSGGFASFLVDEDKPDFDRAGWTW